MTRECPLCGEIMHLREQERQERIPGTMQVSRRIVREWVCAECDYFEEYQDG
jgi:C4-type Zn-finger protein